ncbi:MAG: AAA family ATPase [Flexilinea sp.]
MGNIKKRMEFSTNQEGVDSNTISSGEDNLTVILTALLSLKYYYESIESKRNVESIILIDELDATLHPAFQIKLLEIFSDFSKKFKIQFFITSHSFTLIEKGIRSQHKVIYFTDNLKSVIPDEDIDIYEIKAQLFNDRDSKPPLIPVFTEDPEARLFLNYLFDYYEEKQLYSKSFRKVRKHFHIIDANFGADNLITLFSDDEVLRITMKSICILDGDKT